jgi:pimeloyl-ACP methyl ester carboxylesterase
MMRTPIMLCGVHEHRTAMLLALASVAVANVRRRTADPGRGFLRRSAREQRKPVAALMGLIREPELYECGMDWAGVTGIDLLFNGRWTSDNAIPAEWKNHGLAALVGDSGEDAARFAETSPLKQAARIHQPLLLVYGEDDRRVPIDHGRMLYEAVRKTNQHVDSVVYKNEGYGRALAYGKEDRPEWLYERSGRFDSTAGADAPTGNIDDDIKWIVYEKEGHGWGLAKTSLDFCARVDKFLQQQIGSRAD